MAPKALGAGPQPVLGYKAGDEEVKRMVSNVFQDVRWAEEYVRHTTVMIICKDPMGVGAWIVSDLYRHMQLAGLRVHYLESVATSILDTQTRTGSIRSSRANCGGRAPRGSSSW